MAQRRMFSLKIIDTDVFLDMPLSSQALYFHLSMRADDEGFVSSPKRILKTINCSEDDFKILLAKQFILPFESGVCVIKDWKIHNYIQKDRFNKSIYNEEKSMLSEDENGAYIKCIQNVYKKDTQVRLGKVSLELGKESLGKDIMVCEPDLDSDIHTQHFHLKLTNAEYNKLIAEYDKKDVDDIILDIRNRTKEYLKKYVSFNLTLRSWLKRNGGKNTANKTNESIDNKSMIDDWIEANKRGK